MNDMTPQQAARARKVMQGAQHNDGTAKLVFDGGYVHVRCGSPAEVARPPALMAYCSKCEVVPSREVERDRA